MTPKEKAAELSNKYFEQFLAFGEYLSIEKANQCALIAVDYVIIGIYQIDHKHTAVYDNKGTFYNYKECQELKYWQEVKKELESL